MSTQHPDLPRTEDGFVETSAAYGHLWLVEVTYNTDTEGRWVADDNYENRTLHGPFYTEVEANEWLQDYPDDTDVKEMRVVVLNTVRSE